MLLQAQAAAPEQAAVWVQTAQFFNRQDRFDEAMTAFARLTRLDPADPQPFYQMAVWYEEKVRKDASLQSAQQAHYLMAGMEAVDQALALRPEDFEALVYKNLLLRHQARFAPDPQAQRLGCTRKPIACNGRRSRCAIGRPAVDGCPESGHTTLATDRAHAGPGPALSTPVRAASQSPPPPGA